MLEKEQGELPKAAILRCQVRYFSEGAILGSAEFVRTLMDSWYQKQHNKRPPKLNAMDASSWGDLAVIRKLHKQKFS